MSSPSSPLPPSDNGVNGGNGGSTPTAKTKEKKRVGFSAGDGTPLKEEKEFSWEPAHSESSSARQHHLPPPLPLPHRQPDDLEHERHSDGVDHNELTRALSLILQADEHQPQSLSQSLPQSLPHSQSHSRSHSQSQAQSQSQPQPLSQQPHASLTVPTPAYQNAKYSPRSNQTRPGPIQLPGSAYLTTERQQQSERAAKERADRLAQSVERANSNPASRAASIDGDSDAEEDATAAAISAYYNRRRHRSNTAGPGGRRDFSFTQGDDSHVDLERGGDTPELDPVHSTALRIVRAHSLAMPNLPRMAPMDSTADFQYDASLSVAAGRSGASTPTGLYERDGHEYVPPPTRYHGGVLSSLLRLYNNNVQGGSGQTSGQSTPGGGGTTPAGTTPSSSQPPSPTLRSMDYSSATATGVDTPKRLSGLFNLIHGKGDKSDKEKSEKGDKDHKGDKGDKHPWKHHKHTASSTSLSAGLLGTSSMLVSAGSADIGSAVTERVKRERPPLKRNRSSNLFNVSSPKSGKHRKDKDSNGHRRRREEEIRITVHIAHVISRHRYLTKLCRALMMFGAPTHRLEDYLKMSSRVLEIEAQFLYIPGCMLVSFDDSSTHTAEVKLVRAPQGVDLGKLRDVHTIYKEVVHDRISVDEASARLDAVINRKIKFKSWIRVPVYGLASVCVAPFAFQGRFIDLPIAFILGCIVGLLALVAAPSSAMYSNVFEISAAVITSFLARAAGSISGGSIFCFSALAQSSIALILPGYMVLCSSLELQSQNIVAGSVRMVYAMIYTLFLGYGITIGSAVYGAIDSKATSSTTCNNALSRPWYFLFVPLFTICLCIINQAKLKQLPIMVIISVAGFAVNTYASKHFSSNAQIPNTLGALCIGVLANLYARLSRYFERYFLLFWAKYMEPFMDRFSLRQRQNQWRGFRHANSVPGLGKSNGSRGRGRGASGSASDMPRPSGSHMDSGGIRDGYFDLPPYRKEVETEGETPITGSNGTTGANGVHAGEAGGADTTAAGLHAQAQAHSDAMVAEVEAQAAAAAEAERKAPGQAEVMGYGLAAAAMLPAIFVQVPSGLAVNGSLLSGIDAANNLTGNSTSSDGVNSVAFSVLYSVIQVAIGITVGLFLSALIVYPFGKRRSALFSF